MIPDGAAVMIGGFMAVDLVEPALRADFARINAFLVDWAVFERIEKDWGKLDIVVHSIASAPKDDLQGDLL